MVARRDFELEKTPFAELFGVVGIRIKTDEKGVVTSCRNPRRLDCELHFLTFDDFETLKATKHVSAARKPAPPLDRFR
jgi:hypothetical protein